MSWGGPERNTGPHINGILWEGPAQTDTGSPAKACKRCSYRVDDEVKYGSYQLMRPVPPPAP
jgi:hypothetical protein